MASEVVREIPRMVLWSLLAAGLLMIWRVLVPHSLGVLFLESMTLALYPAGAQGLVPSLSKRSLEERLVRTGIQAGYYLLCALGAGFLLMAAVVALYATGHRNQEDAYLLALLAGCPLGLFLLLFWPSMASAFFLEWPHSVYNMHMWWSWWHIHPGLLRAFHVSIRKEVFVRFGLAGCLCSAGFWAGLLYVCGVFHEKTEPPGLFPSLGILFVAFPALGALLVHLAYQAFDRVSPQFIMHVQPPPPLPSPQELEEAKNRELEDKERLAARPILVAYQDLHGVELRHRDPDTPIGVFSGDTRTSVGRNLTPTEALSPRWVQHMEKAGAQWFIPIVQELRQGRPLDPELVEKVRREALRRTKRAVL